MVSGSYARAAGLQSEINKVTLTRVAGYEMAYNRCLDSFRKDMRIHINIIHREQERLRNSLARYSQKMKKDHKERKIRLRREYSFDRRYARLMFDIKEGGVEETEKEVDQEEEEEGETKYGYEGEIGETKSGYERKEWETGVYKEKVEEADGYEGKVGETKDGYVGKIGLTKDGNERKVRETKYLHGEKAGETKDLYEGSSHRGEGTKATNYCQTKKSKQEPTESNLFRGKSLLSLSSLPQKLPLNAGMTQFHESMCSLPCSNGTASLSQEQTHRLNATGIQRRSHSTFIKTPRDFSTKKAVNRSGKNDLPKDENETKDATYRFPDTRDNIHFRGVHGDPNSSYSLIRTAAIIYPIKYGYDSTKERGVISLPLLKGKATKKVSTKAQRHWQIVKQKQTAIRRKTQKINRLPKGKDSESQSTSKYVMTMNLDKHWSKTDEHFNLPRLSTQDISHRALAKKELSPRNDSQTTWLGLTSDQILSPTQAGRYRGDCTINQSSINSKMVWKSVYQKLKIVHTLGSLSDVFHI